MHAATEVTPAAGGVVAMDIDAESMVQIDVPPDAVVIPIRVEADYSSPAALVSEEGLGRLGLSADNRISGSLELRPHGFAFAKPVTVVLPYCLEDVDAADVTLLHLPDGVGDRWEAVPMSLKDGHVVASVSSFGVFAVFSRALSRTHKVYATIDLSCTGSLAGKSSSWSGNLNLVPKGFVAPDSFDRRTADGPFKIKNGTQITGIDMNIVEDDDKISGRAWSSSGVCFDGDIIHLPFCAVVRFKAPTAGLPVLAQFGVQGKKAPLFSTRPYTMNAEEYLNAKSESPRTEDHADKLAKISASFLNGPRLRVRRRSSSTSQLMPHRYSYTSMLSYRQSTDTDLALRMHDKIHLECFAILSEEQRAPNGVFLDKRSLAGGEDWQQGFINAVSSSLIFVPLLSSYPGGGSVASFQKCDPEAGNDYVDNVLLELELALELRKCSTAPLRCIYPILVGQANGDRYESFDFSNVNQLSAAVSEKTKAKVKEQLDKMGITPSAEFAARSIKQIVESTLRFQGIVLSDLGQSDIAQQTAAKAIVLKARSLLKEDSESSPPSTSRSTSPVD